MELAEVVGQLAGLRRFPVTSLGGESIDECRIQGLGQIRQREMLGQGHLHLNAVDAAVLAQPAQAAAGIVQRRVLRNLLDGRFDAGCAEGTLELTRVDRGLRVGAKLNDRHSGRDSTPLR